MIGVYRDRFEHPYLLLLLPIAAILFGLWEVTEASSWRTETGFLVLYAMVAADQLRCVLPSEVQHPRAPVVALPSLPDRLECPVPVPDLEDAVA